MQLVHLHDYQIAIGNDINHFRISEVKILHERRNLSEQTSVTGYFGFAVSSATFFAKTDSFVKPSVDTNE